MGPQKSTYIYIKFDGLSNKINGLIKLLFFSFSVPEDQVDQPADEGNNGNKMPEEFCFYGTEIFEDDIDQGQYGQA